MRMPTMGTLLAALILAAGTGWTDDAPVQAKSTLENLQAAFDGESNAHARYVAFAEKADEEGYAGAASLFRAAAAAEEIHAKTHAKVIKDMGAEPKADIKKPEVKATAENVKAAIKGETYERDEMYPAFIKQAKAEGNRAAAKSFTYALDAEAEHAKLYTEASDNLDSWKEGKKEFFICPKCGFTTLDAAMEECPTCSTERDDFVKVT